MTEPGRTPSDKDWDGAVNEVMTKVAEHEAAVRAVEAGRPRRSRIWLLLFSGLAILGSAVFNVWYFTRPPPGLPPEVVTRDLRWEAWAVAQEVEAFREQEGRLPSPEEISEVMDEGVSYTADGEHYRIAVEDGDLRVVYEDTVPLDTWVAGKDDGGWRQGEAVGERAPPEERRP
ncbi:MAG: hypothetical protein ACE5GJ_05330 [Gemmatimonadota bacterium]